MVEGMNGSSSDFMMAMYEHQNAVLKEINLEALDFFFRHIKVKEIRCVLLTGSVANCEGTVIDWGSPVVTSDFDFVVYLSLSNFLKKRWHFQKLSQKLTASFREKGLEAHIDFLPSTMALDRLSGFVRSSIYVYEFAHASRCLIGRKPNLNESARPTKMDALELAFTVVSDLVFANLRALSEVEETYVYAKRALTLLNSILIFQGFLGETYQKRIRIAQKHADEIPLDRDEMEMLTIFTKYKLSGSLSQLVTSLGCTSISNLICLQRGFLNKLTVKTLYYELECLRRKAKITPKYFSSVEEMARELAPLLKEYYRHSRIRPLSRVLGIILYIFWSLAGDKRKKGLFATFVFRSKSPKSILNVLTTMLLTHRDKISLGNALKEAFPWITFDDEIGPLQEIFSLWQVAEQSIKL